MSNETPAEVLAEMRRRLPHSGLHQWADRLERSLAAGKVEPTAWRIHWSESDFGAPELTDDSERVAKVAALDIPPRIVPLYTAPPADPAKSSAPEAIRVAVDELCWIANSDPCASQGDTVMEIRGRAKQALQRIEAMSAKASGSAPDDRSEWSLHDRVEFALRDAGFDYDLAFDIASKAATPPASAPEVYKKLIEAAKLLARSFERRLSRDDRRELWSALGLPFGFSPNIDVIRAEAKEQFRRALTAALQEGKSHDQ